MKHTLKRLLALVLTIAMVCGVLPTLAFAEEPTEASAELITAEDDALVQADILDDINAYFDASAKRSSERTLADYVAATDDVKALVMASDTYVEGSIVERGDGFFWQTDTGITCGYFPKDRYEADQRVATKSVNTSALATWSYANATKKDVCLVAPMYSEDSTFTNQYTNEALAIAEATGGTAYGLIDTDATVTAIGQAIEKCGVVIFDSHGNTDWGYFDGGSDGTGEADCTSQANTSYLCLSSGTGMTTADCALVTGTYGTYPHAYKDSSGNYVADGTAFANHMSGDAPSSILWMAICLGMATDGMCAPLRNKGVSVVYGYSQSVSFDGDYAYESSFWDSMIAGDTVATAISTMKSSLGKWDPAYSSYSFSTAVANYIAFPIVASEEDTYPGQGNVDNYQTVNSTWKLTSLSTPAEPITLTLNDNGTVTTQTDTSFTLPSCTAPTGYTFAGWSATALSSEVTAKPTLYAAGSTYTNESDITLYAVYSRTDESGTGTGDYVKVTSTPSDWSGEYVIVYEDGSVIFDGSLTTLDAVSNTQSVTISNNTIAAEEADPYKFTIAAYSSGYSILSASGKYIGKSSNANGLDAGTSEVVNTISLNGDETVNIISAGGAYLRYNATSGQYRFRYYKSSSYSSQKAIALYVKDGSAGTTYYTTAPTTCEHANTVNTDAVAATCTSVGYTAGVYCNDCGKYISGHEEIAMTDHTYGDWTSNNNGTHSRTCSVCGNVETADCTYTSSVSGATTTYTCSVCGYSYSETKDTYTITYSAPSGTTTADVIDGNSVTLPTAEAVDGYTFKGWVTAAIATETTTAPTILTGTYTPSASVTLYAVYSRTETTTGSGSSVYTLVTDPAQLQIGSSIIFTMNGTDTGAMSATQGTNNRAVVDGGTKSDDLSTFTPADGTGEFVLGYGTTDGTYSFYDDVNSGYLYAASSSSNYLRTQSTLDANGSWTIAISSNEATITAQGGNTHNMLRYNTTSKLFSCYTSGQQAVNIYQKGSGTTTTTYYTTSPAVCAHANTTDVAEVPATCTSVGYTAGVYCNDCEQYISGHEEIAMTDHSYGAWTSNNNGTHSRTCSVCGDVETADCTYTTSVSGATTTYTCSVCGYSYSETKDTYTVTYSAPSGTTTADVIDGESVTLPTADAVEGYTFSGWVTAEIDPETAAAPTILTGTYTPTASVTLYALYTRTVSTGSGAASLTKMVAGDTLSAGDNIVVVANGTTVAMYQETISSSYVNLFTFDGNAESIAADSKNYWTVSAGSTTGTYVLGDDENGYLYTSGSNNLAASSSASDWTLVDNGDGTFKLQANGRNLSYRSDLTSNIYWRMGGSNFGTTGNTVLDIYKYVPGSASTTYYTTNPTVTEECAHTNVTAVAAVDATCTTAGNLAYWHCTDCDKYFSDAECTTETTLEAVTVSALGHNWVEATEGDNYVAPTCTETGLAFMVCSVCGEVGAGREIPALGHDMVPGTVHPATCTEDGYTEYACSRCDATDIGDIVSATGHTEVTDDAVEATCTTDGLTAGSHCSVCGEVLVAQEVVSATGHTEVTDAAVAPTCTETGLTAGSHCSVCGVTIVAQTVVPATGHTEVTDAAVAPTCTETGLTAGSHCSVCGATIVEQTVVPATGHTEVTDAAVAPTCTETGLTEGSHCSVCGVTIVAQETVAALGHSYTYVDNGDGTHTATCTTCGNTTTEAHSFTDGTCVCGAAEGPIAAADLVFFNKSLVLKSYTAFNVICKYSVLNNYDSYYVVFERYDSSTGTVDRVQTAGATSTASANYHSFEYPVLSYMMTDEITATLYAVKDGITYVGETYTNSVRAYALGKIGTATEAMKSVYANLLNYGARAQEHMSYKTDDLATVGLDSYESYIVTSVPTTNNTSSITTDGYTEIQLMTRALGLNAAVELQYVLKKTTAYAKEDLYAVYSFTRNGETIEGRIDGEDFALVSGYITIKVSALYATEGNTPVSLTVYSKADDSRLSETWTYSIESHVNLKVTGEPTTTQQKVLVALMNYYNAVSAAY